MAKGALTRSRILDEALRLASRDGLEGLSIGSLAAALDLSKSGLFAHFGSKEALQVAVLTEAGQRFGARVLAPLEAIPEALPRLEALFEGWLAWVQDPDLPGGCPVVAACFELDDREGAPRELLVAMQERLGRRLEELFTKAFPEADGEQAAFDLWGILLAFHHAHRVRRDPRAAARARLAFDRLLGNMVQEGRSSQPGQG